MVLLSLYIFHKKLNIKSLIAIVNAADTKLINVKKFLIYFPHTIIIADKIIILRLIYIFLV